MEEKIIEKIQKLLSLANSSNENEAMAAALKAQELMAKYEINLSQVQENHEDREIVEKIYFQTGKHEMKKWKYGLASIIANNFMCKTFCYGADVVFYGYKEDAEIALRTFQYLYETGNKFAVRYYNRCKKEGKPTNGVMNTYLTGFKAGIKQVLEKQCTALMIVTPQKVIDAYDEKMQGAKVHTIKIKSAKDTDAYNEGKFDGKSMIEQKMLAV